MDSNNSPAPTGIEKAVCEDIARRQALGVAKYGTTVADNPLSLREWCNHLYEELLDAAVYTKRAIEEIDRTGRGPARYTEVDGPRIYPGEHGYETAGYEEFPIMRIAEHPTRTPGNL